MKLVQEFDFGIGECKAGCVLLTQKNPEVLKEFLNSREFS